METVQKANLTQEAKKQSDKTIEQIKAGLMQMVEGLKTLEEELNESQAEGILKDHVLPLLLEDNAIYATSIFIKMEVVKMVHFDSVIDEKCNSMERAISNMNADAICWVSDHVYNINEIVSMIESNKQDQKHRTRTVQNLKQESEQLCGWLINEAYERNQRYEFEIKKLLDKN